MKTLAESIYYSLVGELTEDNQVPGVEDAFAPDSECDKLYVEISEAAQRLSDRLGISSFDRDIEIIMGNYMQIQKLLCLKMFHYGAKMGK